MDTELPVFDPTVFTAEGYKTVLDPDFTQEYLEVADLKSFKDIMHCNNIFRIGVWQYFHCHGRWEFNPDVWSIYLEPTVVILKIYGSPSRECDCRCQCRCDCSARYRDWRMCECCDGFECQHNDLNECQIVLEKDSTGVYRGETEEFSAVLALPCKYFPGDMSFVEALERLNKRRSAVRTIEKYIQDWLYRPGGNLYQKFLENFVKNCAGNTAENTAENEVSDTR